MKEPEREGTADLTDEQRLEIADLRLGTDEEAEALAKEALANPCAFIFRVRIRASHEAAAAALHPRRGLFQPADCEDGPAASRQPMLELLEEDAVARRWGQLLLQQLQIMEEAGLHEAADAVHSEWETSFANNLAANRVLERWGKRILKLRELTTRELRPSSVRAKGRRAGAQKQHDDAEFTWSKVEDFIRKDLNMPGKTKKSASESAARHIDELSRADKRIHRLKFSIIYQAVQSGRISVGR